MGLSICNKMSTCFPYEDGALRQEDIHRAQACKPEKREDEIKGATSILESRKIIRNMVEYKTSDEPQKHTQ